MTNLYKFPVEGGVISDATTRLNQNFSSLLGVTINNGIRQAIDRASVFSADGEDVFVEAYTSAGGRNGSVSVNADITTATFDTNKYQITSIDLSSDTNLVYADIYAEDVSISGMNDLANNIRTVKLDDGLWRIYSYKNSKNESINRLLTRLFRTFNLGSSINHITGLDSIRISESNLRSKKAVYIGAARSSTSSQTAGNLTLSFSATDSNDVLVVSDILSKGASTGVATAYVESPPGTLIHDTGFVNSVNHSNTNVLHYTSGSNGVRVGGTTSSSGSNMSWSASTVVLFSDNLTSSYTVTEGIHVSSYNVTDTFLISSMAPDTTTYPINQNFGEITHNIPTVFQKPMVICVGKALLEDFETGAKVQFKLQDSSTGDTGWLEPSEISSFTAITPTKLIVKLIPKDSDPTSGYPSIRGFGFIGGSQNE